MDILRSDVLCPYCLERLRNKDLKMICHLCGNEVIPTTSELLLQMSMHRLPKCKQPNCHGYARERECGYCGSRLPSDIMDYEKYLRFSLLGISGCGKTNFLTTMLHELKNTVDTPWVIAPMDRRTTVTYQENDDDIYDKRKPAPVTTPGVTPPPQFWRIKDKNRITDRVIPSYSMTIFDGAGEDTAHIDPVISRYIEGSKVLVILIDPLALSGVAKGIPKDILNWSTTSKHGDNASADMVDGLANYIRQSCNISPNTLINRDVAVVFTKIDTVKDSFGSATVMQPSPHLAHKGFVKSDADAVDAEIRDWLESQGEIAFLNSIETNFRNDKVRFFGVSSFGQPPTGEYQLARVMPHRVLDPLIWMLSKEGIARTL